MSQIRAGSIQSVPGTEITEGEIMKLVRIKRPPKIAAGGTLMALPTCEQPCISSMNTKIRLRSIMTSN